MNPAQQRMLPWIVVAAAAVVVLIVSSFIINMSRSVTNDAVVPNDATSQSAPSATSSPKPNSAKPQATPERSQSGALASAQPSASPSASASAVAPTVDPGPTNPLGFDGWNVTGDLSAKLGQTSFTVNGESMLLDSALPKTLPASCAAAQQGWGISRSQTADAAHPKTVGADHYGLIRPAESCAADPGLYNTVWGLYEAYLKSLKSM